MKLIESGSHAVTHTHMHVLVSVSVLIIELQRAPVEAAGDLSSEINVSVQLFPSKNTAHPTKRTDCIQRLN